MIQFLIKNFNFKKKRIINLKFTLKNKINKKNKNKILESDGTDDVDDEEQGKDTEYDSCFSY